MNDVKAVVLASISGKYLRQLEITTLIVMVMNWRTILLLPSILEQIQKQEQG